MALPQKWELRRQGYADFNPWILREVNGQTKTIGRVARGGVDFVCNSDFVSRKHCKVSFDSGVFYLEDLDSLNGTFLNGTQLRSHQKRELRDGDVIGVGLSNAEEANERPYFMLLFRKCHGTSSKKSAKEGLNRQAQELPPPVIDLASDNEDDNACVIEENNSNSVEVSDERKTRDEVQALPEKEKNVIYEPVVKLRRVDRTHPSLYTKAIDRSSVFVSLAKGYTSSDDSDSIVRTKKRIRKLDSDSELEDEVHIGEEEKDDKDSTSGKGKPKRDKVEPMLLSSASSESDRSSPSPSNHDMPSPVSKRDTSMKDADASRNVSNDDTRLNLAKEKVQSNQIQQRVTQVLDHVPQPRKQRGWQPPQNTLPKDTTSIFGPHKNFYSNPNISTVAQTVQPDLQTRKEKLAEVARNQKLNKAQTLTDKKTVSSAPVAKVTPRNRQDMLLESLAPRSSKLETKKKEKLLTAPKSAGLGTFANLGLRTEFEGDVCAGPSTVVPKKSVVQDDNLPLAKIQREMDKFKPSNQAVVTPIPISTQMPQATNSEQILFPAVKRTQAALQRSEDRVYRDILLNWKTEWLQTDWGRCPPPVHGNLNLITNLPHYKGDFVSYVDTFYPLMLHELWSSIVNDYQKKNRQNSQRMSRSVGCCEFDVGIERIEHTIKCPLLTTERSNSKQNPIIKTSFWQIFHLMGFTDQKGSFNRDLDFAKIHLDVNVKSDKNVTEKRIEIFCFVVPNSDHYEEVNQATVVHTSLFQENPDKKKFKYCFQVVTHVSQVMDVLVEKKCRIEKIAYIHPKIRDFRTFSQVTESKLFQLILNPQFPRKEEMYDPNKVCSPAELIRSVHKQLNPSQQTIVHYISSKILTSSSAELLLLHGPPGTGKTKSIVYIILQMLLSSKRAKPKILLCTPSNSSLDELIRRLDKVFGADIKMVRIGQSCSTDIKKYTMDEQIKNHNDNSQIQSIVETISSIASKISALEVEVQSMRAASDPNILAAKIAAINDLRDRKNLHASDLEKLRSNRRNSEVVRRQILSEAHVVASTLNSCASLRRDILALNKNSDASLPFFKCCITDEATQTNEPENLSPLTLGCDKLVLVGDPKQLPATVISNEAERRLFGQSLFTRVFNFYEEESRKSQNLSSPVMMLTQQYRMHPDILRWPNQRFYDGKLLTHSSVIEDPKRKLRIRPYVFLNIKGQEARNCANQISNVNEVSLTREVLRILQNQQTINENHRGLSIGVISPYNEQKEKLRKILHEFKKNESDAKFADTIEIDTVDSFQGREKDIVLLSCVRTDDLGFLKTPERLNVALTRARMALIIIGDAGCLNKNEMWQNLMNNAVEHDAFLKIPDDYRDKGDKYLREVLEQRLISRYPNSY